MADAPNVPSDKPGDGRGVIKWSAVYEAMTGATAPGGHHEDKPGVYTDSLQAGHEPDKFAVKGIIMVPVLVVVMAGLAYGVVTGLFAYFRPGVPVATAETVPQAAAREAQPYNERAGTISSTDEKAEVPQPRLEYVRQIEQRPTGDGGVEPPYLRSFKAKDTPTNSPELTPQDLYPHQYTEYQNGQAVRPLADYGWVSQGKGVARVPVEDAIKALAGKLPAKPGTVTSSVSDLPKISNGGQASGPGDPQAVQGGGPAKADEKHAPKDDHGHKPGEKKDDHKPNDKK